MKNNFLNKKKTKGYALLFTMVIISVIMVIATGISSNISKQLILSATASQSQIAFYEADTAIECALYASQVQDLLLLSTTSPFTFDCGGITSTVSSSGTDMYKLNSFISKYPCFNIDIDESKTVYADNTVFAYGYNICDSTNKNSIERGIEITY